MITGRHEINLYTTPTKLREMADELEKEIALSNFKSSIISATFVDPEGQYILKIRYKEYE